MYLKLKKKPDYKTLKCGLCYEKILKANFYVCNNKNEINKIYTQYISLMKIKI